MSREVRPYMSPAALDLARRLVARPEWRWVRGMAAMAPESGHHWRCDHRGAWMCEAKVNGLCLGGWVATLPPWEMVPDLTDAATAGVLLSWLPTGWSVMGRTPSDRADLFETRAIDYQPFEVACRLATGTYLLRGAAPTLGEAVARALLATWGTP